MKLCISWQMIVGFLLSFCLQRFSSLVVVFTILNKSGLTPLLGKFLLMEHLRPTLPPLVFELRTTDLLLMVGGGLLLFLLGNAGLMAWSKRKSVAFTRGIQCGFVFALLPLYTLGQIALVQMGLRRLASQLKQNEDIQREIVQKAKAGNCGSLDLSQQASCFARIATEKQDPAFCMRIEADQTMGQFRRDFCLSDVAERARNPGICHQIERASIAASCIQNVLKVMNINQQIASHSDYPTHRDICARFEPKGDLDASEKESCFREVAIYENDAVLCETMQSPSVRDDCKDTVEMRLSRGIGPKEKNTVATSSSAVSHEQLSTTPTAFAPSKTTLFSSKFFTLSFMVPDGFEVRVEQNSIRIAKAPFTDRAIGDDNAFFGLTRYSQYSAQESETARYKKLLQNQKASTIVIDGSSFPTLSGEDWGRFEGTSAGRVFVVFFPKSRLEVIERPANADQSFNPITLGKQILATMKFSK